MLDLIKGRVLFGAGGYCMELDRNVGRPPLAWLCWH